MDTEAGEVIFTKDILAKEIAKKGWSVGDRTYGSPTVIDHNGRGHLTIGKFCSIAEGVTILLGGEHRHDWITTYPFAGADHIRWEGAGELDGRGTSKGPVWIGSDVWIGYGALILSGVRVGHGAVIGARAVVASDVGPYAMVAGNPARVIKYRFSDTGIKSLLRIAWWDWPDEKIEEVVPTLCSTDMGALVDYYIHESPPPVG